MANQPPLLPAAESLFETVVTDAGEYNHIMNKGTRQSGQGQTLCGLPHYPGDAWNWRVAEFKSELGKRMCPRCLYMATGTGKPEHPVIAPILALIEKWRKRADSGEAKRFTPRQTRPIWLECAQELEEALNKNG